MSAGEVKYILSLKDLFSSTMQGAEKSVEKFEAKVNASQDTVMRFAKFAAGAFALSKMKDFAMSIVDTGAEFEKAQIGLATLLKSESKAKKAFEDIKVDAATTPFDITSLLQANKLLISTGMDATTARGDVLNLANAIAATGGGI
jgi:phage tail tape-measure protein